MVRGRLGIDDVVSKSEIVFALNETEKIVVELEEPLEEVDCCNRAALAFVSGDVRYFLGIDTVRYKLNGFFRLLSEALDGQLVLHESIKHDVGFVLNECLQSKPACARETVGSDGYFPWVVYRYILWGIDEVVLVYNNDDGEIILELAPCFPGEPTYSHEPGEELDPEEVANLAWYEEWIKDYTPILIRKIPREVAQQWLEQADHILDVIEANVRREFYGDRIIEFTISEKENVMIKFEEPVAQVHGGSAMYIALNIGRHAYVLGGGDIACTIERLVDVLSSALDGQLVRDMALGKDVGCEFNRVLCEFKGQLPDSWIGFRHLWVGSDAVACFYNDSDGAIVLEVTPIFPGLIDPADPAIFDAWLKECKPILARGLPRAVAEKWIEQALEVLEKVANNVLDG